MYKQTDASVDAAPRSRRRLADDVLYYTYLNGMYLASYPCGGDDAYRRGQRSLAEERRATRRERCDEGESTR